MQPNAIRPSRKSERFSERIIILFFFAKLVPANDGKLKPG
jgi:hypothetical protein